MYCRTCGNKLNKNTEICMKCGKSVMTTAQKKKKASNIGLKLLGNVLIVLSIIFFGIMAWNIVVFAMNYGTYGAVGHGAGAFRSLILGLIFFIPGRMCKKK